MRGASPAVCHNRRSARRTGRGPPALNGGWFAGPRPQRAPFATNHAMGRRRGGPTRPKGWNAESIAGEVLVVTAARAGAASGHVVMSTGRQKSRRNTGSPREFCGIGHGTEAFSRCGGQRGTSRSCSATKGPGSADLMAGAAIGDGRLGTLARCAGAARNSIPGVGGDISSTLSQKFLPTEAPPRGAAPAAGRSHRGLVVGGSGPQPPRLFMPLWARSRRRGREQAAGRSRALEIGGRQDIGARRIFAVVN